MSSFKAKVCQIRFPLVLRPRPRWGSLQRSPRPHSCILGGLLVRGGKRKMVGRGRGGKGKGPGSPKYFGLEPPLAFCKVNFTISTSYRQQCCIAFEAILAAASRSKSGSVDAALRRLSSCSSCTCCWAEYGDAACDAAIIHRPTFVSCWRFILPLSIC